MVTPERVSLRPVTPTPPGARPHLVCRPQVCELVLRFGVVLVPVGMELQSQLPVRLFDVPDRRRLADPQDLVEVSPVAERDRP